MKKLKKSNLQNITILHVIQQQLETQGVYISYLACKRDFRTFKSIPIYLTNLVVKTKIIA